MVEHVYPKTRCLAQQGTVSRGEVCPDKRVQTIMLDHYHAQTYPWFSYNKVTGKPTPCREVLHIVGGTDLNNNPLSC